MFTKTHILILTFALVFFVGNDIFIGYLSRASVLEFDSFAGKISNTTGSFSDDVFAKTDLSPTEKSTSDTVATTSPVNFFGTFFSLEEVNITQSNILVPVNLR